jgi:hypothetical protein
MHANQRSPAAARPIYRVLVGPRYWVVDFDAVADELFVLPPAAFIERRNSLAAAARGDNDAQLAAKVKALRRPTVGAALVNALVRERRDAIVSFFSLGAELRDAQAGGDGQEIRALVGRRQQLMRDLDRHIAELAKERGLTATRAVQQDVHATMLAALSHPQAEAIVRAGRLESALSDATFADGAPTATALPTSESHTDARSSRSSTTGRIESAERKLNEANASAAAADDAVEKLAAGVTSAQVELADLDSQLEDTIKQARRLERERSTSDRKVTIAQDAHADAVRRAKVLREAAAQAMTRYEHEKAN